MKNQSIGPQILAWAEVIVSVRVLLFTLPVLLDKKMSGAAAAMGANDWFMILLTLSALLFVAIGLMSVLKNKSSAAVHIVAVVLIGVMTAVLMNRLSTTNLITSPAYFLPAGVAVVMTVLAFILNKKVQSG